MNSTSHSRRPLPGAQGTALPPTPPAPLAAHPPHDHDHDHDHRTPAPAASACAPAGCGCSHGSSHSDGDGHGADDGDHAGHDHGALPGWARVGAALALALLAELWHLFAPAGHTWQAAGMALAAAAIALSGLGIYRSGLRDLARLRLGIHALMAVAVTGAFLIGQWPEAAMVMALYVAAERIEDGAMDRARHAIRQLLALAPDSADMLGSDGQFQRVPARSVPLGATVRIAPGARVPLDGTITRGHSAVNQAPITGESALADKGPGKPLYAGSINTTGELEMRVTSAAGQTTLDRIVHAVEQAQASRAPTQRFIDRFAALYTPAVLVLAVALAVGAPLLLDWGWRDALYQALVLLVMACPCALVIATPVTVVSALTAAARHGILIKGGSALEAARHLRAVALDKTGTLTHGQPTLVAWQTWPEGAASATQHTATAQAALLLAARSDHPVSRAIAQALQADAGSAAARHTAPTLSADAVEHFTALPGRGVQGHINGQPLVLGNLRLVQERGQSSPALEAALAQHAEQGRSVTLLADAHGVRALFAVADTLRAHAPEAIAQLQALGITTVVLSGDNLATVQAIAREAGILEARGALLPEDKLNALAEMQQRLGATAMVGDGINDAPALARADIGFAMGGNGSTGMAMETATVVLMSDDLRRVADTVGLSRRTHRVLWQNIAFALGVKVLFFGLALAGSATLWMAVLADMGASLLVVANGLRLRRWRGQR